jgi:hypothetical protein
MKPIYLAITIIACGPGYDLPYHYYSKCVKVDSELELNQNRLDTHVNKAAEMYNQAFPGEDWCSLMGERRINVFDGPWHCRFVSDKAICDGWSDFGGPLDVNAYGWSLMHESLHLRDADNFDLGTPTHTNWGPKGYYKLAKDFWASGVQNLHDNPEITKHPL